MSRANGGLARAKALSPERRREISKLGTGARWGIRTDSPKEKTMPRKKYVDVKLTMPIGTIEAIDSIVACGILGHTRDEVCEHLLRQHIFEQMVTRVKKDGESNVKA